MKDYKLTLDYFEDIELTSNHPILLEHKEANCELYFHGESIEVYKVIGELLIEHQKVTDNWIEFHHFINGSIEWLLNQQQGLLAKGPESIINIYHNVLESNQVKTSILKLNQLQEETTALLLGKSYIISKEFEFNRLL